MQPSKCTGGENLSPRKEDVVTFYAPGVSLLDSLCDSQAGAMSWLCAKEVCNKKTCR